MKSIRQGQGRKHLGQHDKKLCPSCLTKIVPTRFFYACVILLVGYQYNRSSMALSSIMSNYKEAAAEERVGSKEGEEPSASGENVLHQTDPPMDVFTSTLSVDTSSCVLEKHSLELLKKDSTAVRFHQVKKLKSREKQTLDRFVNEQSALLQLIEDYSKDHNITYDYIFFTRPDLYYTIPFNIKEVERTLEGRMSTLFSPECCKFNGWCDRLGAASYQDFSRMILSSKDWARSGGDKYHYEPAFQHRAEYANLTNFDLTLKKDYGFLALRRKHAAQSCNGKEKVKAFITDYRYHVQ